MQVTNRQHIDYFKVFKLLDLKKIDKHGQVKLIQDKYLNRKVLAVEGNVSTQNYIVFDSNQISKHQPTLSFSQRYLYIVGWMEVAKIFCFQIVLNINAKIYRYLFSTVHKSQKMTPQGIMHMPLEFKSGKWRVIVIDLYELCEKHCPIDQARLSFKLASVQIRAHSRIKNIYLSDNFYDPRSLPKDMEMPLRAGQDFYMKYDFACLSTRTDHKELKQQTKQQQQHNPQKNKNSQKHSDHHHKKQPPTASQHPSPNTSTNNTNTNGKISELNPSKTLKIPHKIKSTKTTNKVVNKNQTLNENISFDDDLHDDVMISNHVPKPKTTIKLDLCALEGYTVACHGVKALGAFIVYPSIFAVHKPIKCMSLHPDNCFKLVVAYNDGSICIWDIIRTKPLLYLKTQLPQIKQISLSGMESEQRIYLVGNDRNKRQTILILNNKDILFRQISNYSIHGFLLTTKSMQNNSNSSQNQQLILSYGFENIRLWKINPNNQIITGVGLYLGKMNRNVVYNCACVVRAGLVAVADNCGYVTLVSVDQEKMEEMKKISENGIDLIVNIKQMEKLLIAQTSGNIKLLSYTLQPVQQYQLSIRIKSLTYTFSSDPTTGNNHLILHINHFNNSCAEFNTQLCSYVYTNRQHTGAVVGLDYHYGLNKVVSLSKDNTIRIWSYFSTPQKKSTMPAYKLSQQYQFLLSNGNSPYSLSVDSSSYVYIGFDEGIMRKIDLNKYEIVEQKSFAFKDNNYELNQMSTNYNNDNKLIISRIKVAKNNKNVLACIQEINNNGICVNMYAVLTDHLLNIIYKYNAPIECQSYAISSSKNYNHSQHQMKVMAGFCEVYKKIYVCWVYGQVYRVQIYSITSDVGQCCAQIYLNSMPMQIRLIGEQLHTFGTNNNQRTSQGIYEIYSQANGQLLQAITTGPYTSSHTTTNPLIVHSNTDQQIQLQLLQQSNIKQTIDMPQSVNNIILHTSQYAPQNTNSDIVDINGIIFCSGVESHALYALTFDLRNVCVRGDRAKKEDDGEMEYQRARQYNMKVNHVVAGERQEDELECVESKLIRFSQISESQSSLTNKASKSSKSGFRKNANGRQTINLERVDEEQSLLQDQNCVPINQRHNSLKRLYQKQQKIYEQCKQFINPQLYSNDNEDFNFSNEEYMDNSEYSHHRYIENTDQDKSHSKKGVQIMYGWHSNYSYNTNFNGSGNNKLIWNPSNQSAIFLNQRSLILHRFSQPIEQKILRLPTYPTLVTKLSNKYVSVTLSNQIRLYSPSLDYIRSFTSLGQSIFSVSISNCEGYLIIVSNTNTTSSTNIVNKKTKLSKCYIQIVDIVTGSTLCSTYRNCIENAVVYVNPYQQSMQFALVTIDALYFYRVTSILTLQTQELEGLNKILSTTDMGAITCTRFMKLAEEELLLLGMQDGSIIIIDSRSNSILLLYRKIVPQQITGILFSIPNSNFCQNSLTLTLMTKSNTIYIYKMQQPTLDEFIRCIDQKPTQQLTTDSQICLFSDIEAVGAEGELAILVTTKLGVLWLIDISGNTTIKILTVHNNTSQQNPNPQAQITKALQIPASYSSNDITLIITGSQDGTVKSTSLSNLQQQFEIYRPRRSVRDLIIANDMLIVCFNLQICCYVPNSSEKDRRGSSKELGSQWRFVGSVDLYDGMGSTCQRITSIKNIAYTDTYIISTTTKLLVMYHQKTLSERTKKLKVQLKQINKGLNNIKNINVSGYNNILVQQADKISIWTRKQKRGQNPIQQLSKIQDIIYYTMDVYQIQAVYAVFLFAKIAGSEYLLCLRNKPIIQWRDFQQHAVVRELEIGVSCPRVLKLGNDGNFLVGDEEGSVWQIKQNGLTLNKVKVFDSAVEGIDELPNEQIMAYGPGLAIINI